MKAENGQEIEMSQGNTCKAAKFYFFAFFETLREFGSGLSVLEFRGL